MYILYLRFSNNHGNGYVEKYNKQLACDSLCNLFLRFEQVKKNTNSDFYIECTLYQKSVLHVQEIKVDLYDTFKNHPTKSVYGDFFVTNHDDMRYICDFYAHGEYYE